MSYYYSDTLVCSVSQLRCLCVMAMYLVSCINGHVLMVMYLVNHAYSDHVFSGHVFSGHVFSGHVSGCIFYVFYGFCHIFYVFFRALFVLFVIFYYLL